MPQGSLHKRSLQQDVHVLVVFGHGLVEVREGLDIVPAQAKQQCPASAWLTVAVGDLTATTTFLGCRIGEKPA